jgi:hypothetical protein
MALSRMVKEPIPSGLGMMPIRHLPGLPGIGARARDWCDAWEIPAAWFCLQRFGSLREQAPHATWPGVLFPLSCH